MHVLASSCMSMRLGGTLQNVGNLSALRCMYHVYGASHRSIGKGLLMYPVSCKHTFQMPAQSLESCIEKCRAIMSFHNGRAGKQNTTVRYSQIARARLLMGALQGVPVLIWCVAASVPLMQHSSAIQ